MLVATTPKLEGQRIVRYASIVNGDAIVVVE
jgi:uncharacterized protein YbjQ (UPF0145 family)